MTKNTYWKHPTFGHVYCGDIASPIGRLVWPSLVKPKDPPPPKEGLPPGQARYEISLLLGKTDAKVKAFIQTLDELVAGGLQLFNTGRSATIGVNSVFGKYGDGDTYDMEKYPYYKGCWVLTARNASVTPVKGKDREDLTADSIKGGMLGRLVVTPLITAHGVSYKLLITQFILDDGVKYGGGVRDAADLLTEISEEPEAVEAPKVETKVVQSKLPIEEAPKPQKQAVGKGKSAAVNLLA